MVWKSFPARSLFLKGAGIGLLGQPGRPKALSAEQAQWALEMRVVEGLSVRDIADELGVSHMCIWRLVKETKGD